MPSYVADPIDPATGLYQREVYDLKVAGKAGLELKRTYRTLDDRQRAFGVGQSLGVDWYLVGDAEHFSWIDMIRDDGSRIHYTRISGLGMADSVFRNVDQPTGFFHSTLHWLGGKWYVQTLGGERMWFRACRGEVFRQCGLVYFRAADGSGFDVVRAPSGNATRVVSTSGQSIDLMYDDHDRVVRAAASDGQTATYEYDAYGRLVRVKNSDGSSAEYRFDQRNLLVYVKEGALELTNTYDKEMRCVRQVSNDGETTDLKYLDGPNKKIQQADTLTHDRRRGTVESERVRFDADGYTIERIFNPGTAKAIDIKYDTQPGSHLLIKADIQCTPGGPTVEVRTPPIGNAPIDPLLLKKCGK